ncbi:MAG: 2'-5' RNA ligase family protein [Thermoproteales archaeon]|nr:2'-5' RNA ligase family protein [Thermoproteales archaeon]
MATYLVGILAPLRRFDPLIPPGYEPIPLEDRHLTLIYLGRLKDPREAAARLKRAASLSPFRLCFGGLEPFPSPLKPRYLAVVPVEESRELLGAVRRAVEELTGLAPRDRYQAFRPHVSIARTRLKPSLELLKAVEKAVRKSRNMVEELLIHELFLLRAEGGRIEKIASLELKGA